MARRRVDPNTPEQDLAAAKRLLEDRKKGRLHKREFAHVGQMFRAAGDHASAESVTRQLTPKAQTLALGLISAPVFPRWRTTDKAAVRS